MNKNAKKTKIIISVVLAVLLLCGVAFGAYKLFNNASLPSEDEAQKLVQTAIDALIDEQSPSAVKQVKAVSFFTVTDVHGSEPTYVECQVKSIALGDVINEKYSEIEAIPTTDSDGKNIKSDVLKKQLNDMLSEYIKSAKSTEMTVSVPIYDVDGKWQVFIKDDFSNAYYGGLVAVTQKLTGSEKLIEKRLLSCVKVTVSGTEPNTDNAIVRAWDSFYEKFKLNFIDDSRWQYLTDGLLKTLEITFFAVILGIILGFLLAIIRCTYDKTGKLKILNFLSKIYLTVIRGTPVVIQLMIIYFVIFAPFRVDKTIVAVIAFAINSGAYVAEIVRGGIMSIDNGQMEAGRSLGFTYTKTMYYIIVPQAFKAVLPSLANEFIVLLKETSVCSFIGLNDLTRGGDIIRGVTYTAFMPLLAVAIIYLVLVIILSYFVGKLERRLRKDDRS